MNNKMLTIAALATVLVAGVFATTQLAFADESETKTIQEIKQKNSGSDASTNVNWETTTFQVSKKNQHS